MLIILCLFPQLCSREVRVIQWIILEIRMQATKQKSGSYGRRMVIYASELGVLGSLSCCYEL